VGKRVAALRVRDRRLRWPIDAKIERAVRGRPVRRVDRRAKYLLIGFDAGTLIVHLGMSGSLRIVSAETPPRPHDHWDLVTDTGKVLRFHDPRRFGSLHWILGDPLEHPLLAKLGPEPLSAEFDAEYLYRATRKRSIAVKQLLMNSQVVVGVGNIYANEALFRARISPRRAAGRLTRAQAQALSKAIKDVLGEAIEIGGTTLRDYVNASGTPGYFKQKLFVYERAKQPCRVCKSLIKQFAQGQRSTYWCPTCQR
jgi:formamidopyrimidine-DNA glycosylase